MNGEEQDVKAGNSVESIGQILKEVTNKNVESKAETSGPSPLLPLSSSKPKPVDPLKKLKSRLEEVRKAKKQLIHEEEELSEEVLQYTVGDWNSRYSKIVENLEEEREARRQLQEEVGDLMLRLEDAQTEIKRLKKELEKASKVNNPKFAHLMEAFKSYMEK